MIEKEYGKYIVECDGCGFVLGEYNTHAEAREAMQEQEWTRTRYNGDWVNYCPDCMSMIERDERKVGVST